MFMFSAAKEGLFDGNEQSPGNSSRSTSPLESACCRVTRCIGDPQRQEVDHPRGHRKEIRTEKRPPVLAAGGKISAGLAGELPHQPAKKNAHPLAGIERQKKAHPSTAERFSSTSKDHAAGSGRAI